MTAPAAVPQPGCDCWQFGAGNNCYCGRPSAAAPQPGDPDEVIRIAIAAALIRSGVDDNDEVELFQWHPCHGCYRPDGPRRGKCGCSGVPYVSDEVWRELAPVIAALHAATAEATRD